MTPMIGQPQVLQPTLMGLAFDLADRGDQLALKGDWGDATEAYTDALVLWRAALLAELTTDTDWLLIWQGKAMLTSFVQFDGRFPAPILTEVVLQQQYSR